MAVSCFAITAVTSTFAEHVDVISELRLYQTTSCIHKGNLEHMKVLKNLRSFKSPPAAGGNKAPPLYQVCLEIRLDQLYECKPHLIPDVD